MQPSALIFRCAGTNCDRELAHAFELAGARTVFAHVNQLIEDASPIERADLIGFPGGFSYGDDIAAGRIFANRLRHRLARPLLAALSRGVPMIGVCNGFQTLVKLGLLPFPEDVTAGKQSATLADNTSGRFIDQWVSLTAQPASVCVWTKNLGAFDLSIAHGEGRFVPIDEATLQRMNSAGQVALRYETNQDAKPQASFPGNPNGSVADIAGVCDPSGLVLGLMPHPERHVHPTQHPLWSRRGDSWLTQTSAGLRFFQNAVEYVKSRAGVTARV